VALEEAAGSSAEWANLMKAIMTCTAVATAVCSRGVE
jgi:hypothetical protein